MSMEEFIRELEKNPNPTGSLTGGSADDELIRTKSKRTVKNPQGEEITEEYVDVDGKTRLTSPASFTVAEATAEMMENAFGNRQGVRLLKMFLGMGPDGKPAGFKVNMISKDGLSRDEHIRLKNRDRQLQDEQSSLLSKLSKM